MWMSDFPNRTTIDGLFFQTVNFLFFPKEGNHDKVLKFASLFPPWRSCFWISLTSPQSISPHTNFLLFTRVGSGLLLLHRLNTILIGDKCNWMNDWGINIGSGLSTPMKQLLAVLLQSCVRGSCTSLHSLKPTHRLLQQLPAQLLPCVLGVNMSKEYAESYILKKVSV